MTRMDDLGEEFTIKFVDDFCNVERSVGDTTIFLQVHLVVNCRVTCPFTLFDRRLIAAMVF